jgi:biopolymer transport protein TolQ
MNVTQDMSVWGLVSNASLFVQLVMLGLLAASLLSWWTIFRKLFVLRQARLDTETFERAFWSGGDLAALYQSASAARERAGSLERIFEAGFREYTKLKRAAGDRGAVIDGTRRAMSATFQRELDALEGNLAFLASVGSVTPYVGLLVAPGIAEALIATAMGLFAAIPAVIAYNRFSTDVDRLAVRFESFIEEFSNILQRQA